MQVDVIKEVSEGAEAGAGTGISKSTGSGQLQVGLGDGAEIRRGQGQDGDRARFPARGSHDPITLEMTLPDTKEERLS